MIIIGRICNREIKKLNNLDIDSQIIFFINLSVFFNGVANENLRKDYLEEFIIKIKILSKNSKDILLSYMKIILFILDMIFLNHIFKLYISITFLKK